MATKKKAIHPARGACGFQFLVKKDKNLCNTRVNKIENTKKLIKVNVGKETEKAKKNRISPNPIASLKKLFFIINREYKKIRNNSSDTMAILKAIENKKNSILAFKKNKKLPKMATKGNKKKYTFLSLTS